AAAANTEADNVLPDGNYTIKNGIVKNYPVAYLGDEPDSSYNYNRSQQVGDEINIYAYYEGKLNGQDYKGLVFVARTSIRAKEMFNGRDAIVTDLLTGWTAHLTTGLSESGSPLSITTGNVVQRKGENKLIPGTEWWQPNLEVDHAYDTEVVSKKNVWKNDGAGHKAGDPVRDGDEINVYSRANSMHYLPEYGGAWYVGREKVYAIDSGEAFSEFRINPNGQIYIKWFQSEQARGLACGQNKVFPDGRTVLGEIDVAGQGFNQGIFNAIFTDNNIKTTEDLKKILAAITSYQGLIKTWADASPDSTEMKIISKRTGMEMASIFSAAEYILQFKQKLTNSGFLQEKVAKVEVGLATVSIDQIRVISSIFQVLIQKNEGSDAKQIIKETFDQISLFFGLDKNNNEVVKSQRYIIFKTFAELFCLGGIDSYTNDITSYGINPTSYQKTTTVGEETVYSNNIKVFVEQVNDYLQKHKSFGDSKQKELEAIVNFSKIIIYQNAALLVNRVSLEQDLNRINFIVPALDSLTDKFIHSSTNRGKIALPSFVILDFITAKDKITVDKLSTLTQALFDNYIEVSEDNYNFAKMFIDDPELFSDLAKSENIDQFAIFHNEPSLELIKQITYFTKDLTGTDKMYALSVFLSCVAEATGKDADNLKKVDLDKYVGALPLYKEIRDSINNSGDSELVGKLDNMQRMNDFVKFFDYLQAQGNADISFEKLRSNGLKQFVIDGIKIALTNQNLYEGLEEAFSNDMLKRATQIADMGYVYQVDDFSWQSNYVNDTANYHLKTNRLIYVLNYIYDITKTSDGKQVGINKALLSLIQDLFNRVNGSDTEDAKIAKNSLVQLEGIITNHAQVLGTSFTDAEVAYLKTNNGKDNLIYQKYAESLADIADFQQYCIAKNIEPTELTKSLFVKVLSGNLNAERLLEINSWLVKVGVTVQLPDSWVKQVLDNKINVNDLESFVKSYSDRDRLTDSDIAQITSLLKVMDDLGDVLIDKLKLASAQNTHKNDRYTIGKALEDLSSHIYLDARGFNNLSDFEMAFRYYLDKIARVKFSDQALEKDMDFNRFIEFSQMLSKNQKFPSSAEELSEEWSYFKEKFMPILEISPTVLGDDAAQGFEDDKFGFLVSLVIVSYNPNEKNFRSFVDSEISFVKFAKFFIADKNFRLLFVTSETQVDNLRVLHNWYTSFMSKAKFSDNCLSNMKDFFGALWSKDITPANLTKNMFDLAYNLANLGYKLQPQNGNTESDYDWIARTAIKQDGSYDQFQYETANELVNVLKANFSPESVEKSEILGTLIAQIKANNQGVGVTIENIKNVAALRDMFDKTLTPQEQRDFVRAFNKYQTIATAVSSFAKAYNKSVVDLSKLTSVAGYGELDSFLAEFISNDVVKGILDGQEPTTIEEYKQYKIEIAKFYFHYLVYTDPNLSKFESGDIDFLLSRGVRYADFFSQVDFEISQSGKELSFEDYKALVEKTESTILEKIKQDYGNSEDEAIADGDEVDACPVGVAPASANLLSSAASSVKNLISSVFGHTVKLPAVAGDFCSFG
ncbi:MAG: hypothetical protein LBM13_03465, partial [Candidatus Ancillula sp.]|nr:hypothetical protein [Candidatus Ancillula sp.]